MSVAAAEWRQRQIDPSWDPAHAENTTACACVVGGVASGDCEQCGGSGIVLQVIEMPELDDQTLEIVGHFLAAKMEVEAWGMAVWMDLHGEPDPAFLEALLVWDSEIAAAEYDRRIREAQEARAARAGKRP